MMQLPGEDVFEEPSDVPFYEMVQYSVHDGDGILPNVTCQVRINPKHYHINHILPIVMPEVRNMMLGQLFQAFPELNRDNVKIDNFRVEHPQLLPNCEPFFISLRNRIVDIDSAMMRKVAESPYRFLEFDPFIPFRVQMMVRKVR